MDLGSVPQWVTAGIALVAGIIAVLGIQTQRQIARRRAAFDMFLKTEADEKMVDAYDNFHKGLAVLKQCESIVEFRESHRKEYFLVRNYLNVHELVAVGIKGKVLDPTICYEYWSEVLINNCRDAKPVLDFVLQRDSSATTYRDLEALRAEWIKRKEREKKARRG